MKRKERGQSVIHTGTTSLVMIFAVLALMTFALLSYSSASAQWRLARKMAERMECYYAAEEQAAERLEVLDTWLKGLALAGTEASEQEFSQLLFGLPETMRDMEWQDGLIYWQIPVGERQQLEVKVEPAKEKEGACWRLLWWKLTGPQGGLDQQPLELYGKEEGAKGEAPGGNGI